MRALFCNHGRRDSGFTLIELSIVLVIIGLIVGGVLVGRDLINAAYVRAQITQIEKYNQAVNAFRGKYGYLPGDLLLSSATQFGFNTTGCTGTAGLRNGDGVIDSGYGPNNWVADWGESGLFWMDLSQAGLIEGGYPNGGAAVGHAKISECPSTRPPQHLILETTFPLPKSALPISSMYMNTTILIGTACPAYTI